MYSDDDYWRFAKERETIQGNVEALLRQFPKTRSDYRILLFYYWHYVDRMISIIPTQITAKMTSPESITRAFRKVVVDNPSLGPTPKTQRERDIHLERMRRYHAAEAREKHEEERRLMM